MSIRYIKNTVKNCDMFGEGIHLLINKKETANTILGGFLTILLLLGLGGTLIITSIDIFLKEKPLVTVENRILPSRPNMTLDNFTFPLSFFVQDGYAHNYNDPRYYTIELRDVTFINSDNGTTQIDVYHEYESCNPYHFPLISNNTFYSTGLQNYYCIKNQNISVGGYYDEKYVRYLGVNLKTCKNSSESNITCAPEEEIKEYFTNTTFYFGLFYQTNVINTQKYSNFTVPYIINKYKAIKYGTTKYFEIFIQNQFLISDNGFIMEYNEETQIMSHEIDTYDFSDMDSEGYLCCFYLYSSNKQQIYRRNYLKIQDVLAQTGALAEVFIRFFKLICLIFTTTSLNKHILNRIYDFDLINRDITKNKNQKGKFKSVTLKKLFDLNNELDENYSPSNRIIIKPPEEKEMDNFNAIKIQPPEEKEMNNLYTANRENRISKRNKVRFLKDSKNILYLINHRRKENNLSFTYFEIIKMYWCCGIPNSIKNKKSLYEKSMNSLDEYLDICYIIKKLEELEKMKFLLLTYEQMAVFNQISKDFCSLNETKQSESSINRFKEFNKDSAKLSETILKFKMKIIENNENLTEIDKKLYDLLRDDLKY
jgi:hypothetical protein